MAGTGVVGVDGPVTRESVDLWRRICRSNHLADSIWIPDEQPVFRASVRSRRLEDLVLIDMTADPFGSRYRPDSSSADFVGFAVHTEPFAERVRLNDRREWTATSRIGLWDNALLAETQILTPAVLTMVLVPKRALPRTDLPRFLRQGSTPADEHGAIVRLLRDLVVATAAEADRLDPAAASAARTAIVELLLTTMRQGDVASTAAVSESMRTAITRWIDEGLATGPLSATDAARHHGISVRSLHRLFAGTGETFGSLVRRRRLERARRDLVAGGDMVQTIAVRWGYADASHFIHEFKRIHGVTPAGYRRGAARTAA